MAGVPVGSYKVGRLANLGTKHWSLDAGGGYTVSRPEEGAPVLGCARLHPQLGGQKWA